jgi:hypothetical protein
MIVIKYGLYTLFLYLSNSYYWWKIRPGISQPSGPRRHRIDRQPQWSQSTSPWPHSIETSDWNYVCGKDSHRATENTVNSNMNNNDNHNKVRLTGEPTGRDIWIHGKAMFPKLQGNGKFIVDNHLVQLLASGGRPLGFQPSTNPNR